MLYFCMYCVAFGFCFWFFVYVMSSFTDPFGDSGVDLNGSLDLINNNMHIRVYKNVAMSSRALPSKYISFMDGKSRKRAHSKKKQCAWREKGENHTNKILHPSPSCQNREIVFNYGNTKVISMAKKQSGGLISSAGLVNYYDSDNRKAIQINPYHVLAVAIACAVIIYLADVLQKTGF